MDKDFSLSIAVQIWLEWVRIAVAWEPLIIDSILSML